MGECSAPHRDTSGEIAQFAPRFIKARFVGFEKDMRICLTAIRHPLKREKTHAYFPALASCCSTLEYLTNLHRGSFNSAGHVEIAAFANQYLPQPAYNSEIIHVLIYAFRHTVAHRGISSGVWVDPRNGQATPKRVVWKITASTRFPALELKAEDGLLRNDPPWPTPFNHRMQINLGRLWRDIKAAAEQYAVDVAVDIQLQNNFRRYMERLYPTP